jgi:4'-phosphopantetheinyl transferase
MTANAIFISALAEDSEDAAGMLSASQSRDLGPPRSRLARALLSSLVADIWGIPREEVRILAEPSGRPVLDPAGLRRVPFVSLSHTRGWAACAASEIGPLGIDIERQRPDRDHAGIAAAAFGPREQARTLKSGIAAFYRIWTLREAIAKATGQGLRLAADGHDRVHEGPDEGSWQLRLDRTYWSLSHSLVRSDLNLATAIMLRNPTQLVALERWGQ